MRYLGSDEIIFTNVEGKTVILIDFQELTLEQKFLKELELKRGDVIDEIAQRDDVYRSDNESEWFRIFDFNAADIMDNKFTLTGLEKLKIPVGDV